ncbi:MAG: fibrinogen-like YCDxxxxGGGW domain-containing protein, partial [Candidatus Gracilibacteria bacterium]|nr:fibrinogen-like YCDxxxxGGGW domain-containing protein [Candidatus Gracilibacteria bacterium]
GSIVVFEGDLLTLSDTTSVGILARKTLIEKLQQAYTGTSIITVGEIAQIINTNTTDEISTEYVSTNLVANNLGGSIKPVTTVPTTVTYANCDATTQSGYTIPQLNHGINNQEVTKSVTNGTKTLQVSCGNGILSYGTEITNCENDYIVSNDVCVLDSCLGTMPDNAELNGTQGTSTWSYNTTPGVCRYDCQDGFHTENGGVSCVSNTRSCVITNGTGQETWNGSSWGVCTVTSCNSGYTQSGNVCNQDILTITGNDTIGRNWSDGTFATNCNGYRNPGLGKSYSGSIGDGIYWIKPNSNPQFKVYCNMTIDGGGWTLLFRWTMIPSVYTSTDVCGLSVNFKTYTNNTTNFPVFTNNISNFGTECLYMNNNTTWNNTFGWVKWNKGVHENSPLNTGFNGYSSVKNGIHKFGIRDNGWGGNGGPNSGFAVWERPSNGGTCGGANTCASAVCGSLERTTSYSCHYDLSNQKFLYVR